MTIRIVLDGAQSTPLRCTIVFCISDEMLMPIERRIFSQDRTLRRSRAVTRCDALCSAVPYNPSALTSAPFSSNNFTTPSWPPPDALCSAVPRLPLHALTSTPLSSSSLTTASWPRCDVLSSASSSCVEGTVIEKQSHGRLMTALRCACSAVS